MIGSPERAGGQDKGIDALLYKSVGLTFAVLFAATGLLFLLIPDRVLILFNAISAPLGMPEAPADSANFYLILAVGYMYLVTVLSLMIFLHPQNRFFPLLLAHGKSASSLLSLALFLFDAHYLIFIANFLVDGLIAVVALILYLKMRRPPEWASS